MKIKGKLLTFNKLFGDGSYFPEDCKIDIPEKLPLLTDFNFSFNSVIGNGVVTRTDDGLYFDGKITVKVEKDVITELYSGLGGYYVKVFTHDDGPKRIVDEAALKCVSLVVHPVFPDFSFEILEDNQ